MERIFISYKRVNKDRVFQLVNYIENQLNVKCWVDLNGIESSTQFAPKICAAIDKADVVLFMHSSAHLSIDFENDWTIKELNYAQQTQKRVVLVRLDDTPLRNIFLMEYGTKNNIDSNQPDQVAKLINDLDKWLNSGNEIKSNPSVSQGRVWNVGDYYDIDGKEGVVFWVDQSRKHGKILSVDQVKMPWCIYKEFNKQLITGSISKDDGLVNLCTIGKIYSWKDKYPAFSWCANHGRGWYLPAIDELKEFLYNQDTFNRVNLTLKKLFSPLLKKKNSYWSSTELGNVQAHIMKEALDTLWMQEGYRYESLYVRAVCRF